MDVPLEQLPNIWPSSYEILHQEYKQRDGLCWNAVACLNCLVGSDITYLQSDQEKDKKQKQIL